MHGSPFANVAAGFPGITSAAASLLHDGIGKPPDLQSIGEKTYAAFTKGNFKGEKCKRKDWRNFPYALWLDQNRGLAGDRKLFDRYYKEHLIPAINTKRRPIKWIKPLIFIYVHEFRPENRDFDYLARRIRDAFKNERILAHEKIKALIDDLNFFDPEEGPRKTGQSILAQGSALDRWQESYDLWSNFIDSPYAERAFQSCLNVSQDLKTSESYVASLIRWVSLVNFKDGILRLRYPNLRPTIANSLLLPWPLDKPIYPADGMKNLLISFFKATYGDPTEMRSFESSRFSLKVGSSENRWKDANPKCPQIILRWMVGDTLKAFFKILEVTADDIWMYRQKFWLAYYNRGLIDEAWVALGPTAQSYARKEFREKNLNFAELNNGNNAQQSVLLLKIGGLIFCEWSHSGRLRAGKEGSPSIPRLYEDAYWASELRFNSMDFNEGLLEDPGLVHFSSSAGGWQDRARNFIRKHLGHNLPLTEVS